MNKVVEQRRGDIFDDNASMGSSRMSNDENKQPMVRGTTQKFESNTKSKRSIAK